MGDSASISWAGVDWQPVLQGISPDLHICIDANEGRDLYLSNEASQTQRDPEEFSALFWLRQLLQHLGRGHEEPAEPSLQIRDGDRILREFGPARLIFPPFPG